MRISVENGFGDAIGVLHLADDLFPEGTVFPQPVDLAWRRKRYFTKRTFTYVENSLRINVDRRSAHGFYTMVKWKDQMKLRRAGMLVPYESEAAHG